MTILKRLKNVPVKKALASERPPQKPAAVLAAFGTAQPRALAALENIEARIRTAFAGYDVRLAFTSGRIRSLWKERGLDEQYRRDHPEVSERYYTINNVLTELANIQEPGARLILVQPLFIAGGGEYGDLAGLIQALKNMAVRQRRLHPFPWLGLGQPALGLGSGTEASLGRAAAALEDLGRLAASGEASVVLMAHGNEHLELPVFGALEKALRQLYGPSVYLGLLEGRRGLAEIQREVQKSARPGSRVHLAPLMVAAGEHALKDLAGPEDSWSAAFQKMGYNVTADLTGLGSCGRWAAIFAEHLRQAEQEVLAQKARDGEGRPAAA